MNSVPACSSRSDDRSGASNCSLKAAYLSIASQNRETGTSGE